LLPLRQHGIPVTVTVTGCLGLLGGSGSNPVGYACRGSYVVDGHRYNEPIPGTALHDPGTRLDGVVAAGDPGLVSTVGLVAAEHPSGRVFVLPGVLVGLLAGLLLVLGVRRRRLATR